MKRRGCSTRPGRPPMRSLGRPPAFGRDTQQSCPAQVAISRQPGAASGFLEAAVADQARAGEGNTPRAAPLLHNLADIYTAQGRADCAVPRYEQASRIWEQGFGPDHPGRLQAMVSLAAIDRERGDLAAAERRLRPALEQLERRFGPDHPEVAGARNNLAEVLRLQGRHGEGAVLYDSALSTLERTLGKNHPATAAVLLNRAVLDWQQGTAAEAVRLAGRGCRTTRARRRHRARLRLRGAEAGVRADAGQRDSRHNLLAGCRIWRSCRPNPRARHRDAEERPRTRRGG